MEITKSDNQEIKSEVDKCIADRMRPAVNVRKEIK